MARPLSSLSLDLDNLWSYLKTHGDARWTSFPSYLDRVVPRILEMLDSLELRITFFIVGQDAVLEKNKEALSAIKAAGHDIGNHSFKHEPWLQTYSAEHIRAELASAEAAIDEVFGVKPKGFRGPGFSLSRLTLEVLNERGYLYDATTFPTFIGPLGRLYFLKGSTLGDAERKQREALFGSWRDGFRPLTPYRWRSPVENTFTLLEIPVTTFPGPRLPIHFSYLVYLAGFSRRLAATYFSGALRACLIRGIEPSLLLHPLDFLGAGEYPELNFFPGMTMNLNTKLHVIHENIRRLKETFDVLDLHTYAEKIRDRAGLPRRTITSVSQGGATDGKNRARSSMIQ